MELQFYGANCFRVSGKGYSIVIDDNLAKLGGKSVTKPTDISLQTSLLTNPPKDSAFNANTPGEYEISGVIIHGIAARAHMDKEAAHTATIYTIEADGARVAVLGHIFPDLSDNQVEEIDNIDVAIVPVGDSGYTLDGQGALSVIKKIEPKIVVPSHYADKDIKYEVPQAELSEAIKTLGMEPAETVDKYKIRSAELTDSTKLVILNRLK